MTIGTVTTLDPGESATVTNIGTSTDAVLDIGIPAGYDGSAVPIDDASTAADRVLSAQYIKAQLSAKVTSTRQLKYWNRPAAYHIKVAAGRFNMSWSNTSGRMWIFLPEQYCTRMALRRSARLRQKSLMWLSLPAVMFGLCLLCGMDCIC